MTYIQQLGRRIKYLRGIRGWTQEDLAFLARINKNYLSDLERGNRNPTLALLKKISSVFNITLSDLVSGID